MKIYINLFSIVLICCLNRSASAQDNFKEVSLESTTTRLSQEDNRYKQEAIYLKTSFFGQRYVKNGVEYRLGYMGRKIQKEFEGFPVAQAEFKKFKKQLIISKVVGLAGCIVALASAFKYSNRASQTPNNEVSPTNSEAGLYFGGLLVGLSAGTWGTISSNNTLQKAIFLRNQAICEGK